MAIPIAPTILIALFSNVNLWYNFDIMVNSFEAILEPKDPLKLEHLKEGVNPIMACVGSPTQFENHPGSRAVTFKKETNPTEALNVDFNELPYILERKKCKNPEVNSYVISSIDSSDKFSEGYANCTGVLAVGRETDTGENISFLSHQYPYYFLNRTVRSTRLQSRQDRFLNDLRESFEKLKGKCEKGTIDAVILGGSYYKGDSNEENQENYLRSIELLSEETQRILGFEPVVITGPKTDERHIVDKTIGYESVFYDNKQRKIYLMRPGIEDTSTETFRPGDVKEKEKKWQTKIE